VPGRSEGGAHIGDVVDERPGVAMDGSLPLVAANRSSRSRCAGPRMSPVRGRTATASNAGPRPSPCSTRLPFGLIWMPAPISDSAVARSWIVTSAIPACARHNPAVSPPIPAPTIATCTAVTLCPHHVRHDRSGDGAVARRAGSVGHHAIPVTAPNASAEQPTAVVEEAPGRQLGPGRRRVQGPAMPRG
jgi:hypothetical protein